MRVIEVMVSVRAYSQNKGWVVAIAGSSEHVEQETWREKSPACFAASSTAEVTSQVNSALAFGKFT